MSGPSFVVVGVVVQVTAVLALALALSRVLARRNAAARAAIGFWALVAALACPAVFAGVSGSGMSWMTLPVVAPTGSTAAEAESEIPADPVPVLPPAPAAPAPLPRPAVEPVLGARIEPAAAPALPAIPRRNLLPFLLPAIWAAGALFLAFRLAWGWRVQARLRSGLRPAELAPILERVRRTMGLSRVPPVAVSPDVRTPCSIGLFKPVLILPQGMPASLPPESIEDILVHECAHVVHRHHWVGLVQRVAALVFWPHPLVHGVNRMLSRALEEVCDNHVLGTREAGRYAKTLLDVVERAGSAEAVPAGVGFLTPRWKLVDRVADLLDRRRKTSTSLRLPALAGVAALFLATGAALAGVRPGQLSRLVASLPSVARAADEEPLPAGALARIGDTSFRHSSSRAGISRGIQALAFSPDGKTLAVGGDYAVSAWEVPSGKRRFLKQSCSGSIAFSPDGKLLVGAGPGDSILAWDAITGADLERGEFRSEKTASHGITAQRPVAFSPDGRTLLAWGGAAVRELDAVTGTELRKLGVPGKSVVALVATPEGRRFGVGYTAKTESVLYDLDSGAEVLKREGNMGGMAPAVSPDGKHLAWIVVKLDGAGGYTFEADVVDLVGMKTLATMENVAAAAFAPDGARVATCDFGDGTIRIRETGGKEIRAIATGRGQITALAFSPDGKTVATGSGSAVRLWDAASGREITPPGGHDTPISTVAFSPDGKLLATGSGSAGVRSVLRAAAGEPIHLWDPATGREVRRLEPVPGPADTIVFSPDGKRLAAAGGSSIALWEVATGKPIFARVAEGDGLRRSRDKFPYGSAAFSPDGRMLVAGGTDGGLRFWNAETGASIRELAGDPVTSIAYSPDGRILALGGADHALRLRDGSGTIEFRKLEISRKNSGTSTTNGVPNPSVIRAVFSPDGRILATEYVGGFGQRTSLWEVASGREMLAWDTNRGLRLTGLAFSPDGRTIAAIDAGHPGGVDLYDAWTTRKISTVAKVANASRRGMWMQMGPVGASLAFSPDGTSLAVAGEDTTVLLWDVSPDRWPVYIRPGKPERELGKVWEDLGSKEAGTGVRAVEELAAFGGRAVAFLRERVRPAVGDAERIRKLIADLDAEDAATRQAAAGQLKAMDSAAEPELVRALEAKPTGELQARLQELAGSVGNPMTELPEALRAGRAVWALERIGSVEARGLLGEWAQSPPGRLSRAAQSALRRGEGR